MSLRPEAPQMSEQTDPLGGLSVQRWGPWLLGEEEYSHKSPNETNC